MVFLKFVFELTVFLCLIFFFQFSLKRSHPLVIGFRLLTVMVLVGGGVCSYGSLFGFTIFLVVIGGVLVVFSYAVSLVPFKHSTLKRDELSVFRSEYFLDIINRKSFYKVLGGGLLISYLVYVVSLYGNQIREKFLLYSDIGYFSCDYRFSLL